MMSALMGAARCEIRAQIGMRRRQRCTIKFPSESEMTSAAATHPPNFNSTARRRRFGRWRKHALWRDAQVPIIIYLLFQRYNNCTAAMRPFKNLLYFFLTTQVSARQNDIIYVCALRYPPLRGNSSLCCENNNGAINGGAAKKCAAGSNYYLIYISLCRVCVSIFHIPFVQHRFSLFDSISECG